MRDIPGFAWDEKRQRYFRILKSGQAPHSSAHSWTVGEIASSKREIKRQALDSKPLPLLPDASSRTTILSSQRNETSCLSQLSKVSNIRTSLLASHGGAIWGGSLEGALICISRQHKNISSVSLDGATVGLGEMISLCRETGSVSLYHDRLLCLPPSASIICQYSTFVGTEKGIFSIDAEFWKAKSAIVAMADSVVGQRNGNLATWDRRMSKLSQWEKGHDSRPTRIMDIGSSQILVSGLKDQMTLYDERMQMPLHSFSGYLNWSNPYLGVSLNPARTSVASATDSHVKVWDVQSGIELPLRNRLHAIALIWTEDGIFFDSHEGLKVYQSKPIDWTSRGENIDSVAEAFRHAPHSITEPLSLSTNEYEL